MNSKRPLIIIVASTRVPKVNGVRRAMLRLLGSSAHASDRFLIETTEAASGVSDTPRSIEEMMRGAENRARAVHRSVPSETVVSIGVEGGLFMMNGLTFLQSWCCVFDGTHVHFGSAGALELPDVLATDVMRNGAELGDAIDRFAQQKDVRSRQGTYGVLTADIVTREDSFEEAALLALTPFFRSGLYSSSGNTELTIA